MQALPNPASGRAVPTASTLSETLLQIHRQNRLAGVLEATAIGISRLGVHVYAGALLRDGGSDAWYLASLVDSRGRAVPPSRHGISDQPLAFKLPASDGPLPLPLLFNGALDDVAYDRLSGTLRVGGGVCLPLITGSEPSGALFALFTSPEPGQMVASLLSHAALAAARVLEEEANSGVRRLLDATAFTNAAEIELARCDVTGRQASLIVCSADSVGEMAALGRGLLRIARAWDIAGRAPAEELAVALLLPEIDRVDARILLRKVDGRDRGGVATFPDDGTSLTRLVTIALSRTTVGEVISPQREQREWRPASRGWTRGLRITPHADVMRCPVCNVAYTRQRPPLTAAPDESDLRAVRESLVEQCPSHGPELML